MIHKNTHWLEKTIAALAQGLRYHFTLLSCNPKYTVADINSDIVELKMHPRNH